MIAFALTEEIDELIAAARRFAAESLSPSVRDAEGAGVWSNEVLEVLRGFALSEVDLPASLGGAGAGDGSLTKVALLETLAYGDAGGLPAADPAGQTAGALIACPDRGLVEDLARECVAGHAQIVLAVGDDDLDPPRIEWAASWPSLRWAFVSKADELALFEVDGTQPTPALAFHASGGISAALEGAKKIGSWTLEPGAGIAVRGRARLWAAAVAVGIAQAAFDATIAYTTERVVFGKPVAYHQGNAFELAALATSVHGSRLAVREAATSFDASDPSAGFWATQAWLFAIDTAVAVTDAGIQLLGGHGFLVDHLAEKRFREARMLGLLAGARDSADADVSECALDVRDLFGRTK